MEGNSSKQQQFTEGPYDNEISLFDLWLVIARRKWLVISIIILSFSLGLIYAAFKPVRYQYKTGIDLARLPERSNCSEAFKLVLPKKYTIDSLENTIIPEERKVLFGKNTQNPKVQILDQKDTYSITLATTARQEEAEKAEKLHKAAAVVLIKEHDHILQKLLSVKINPLKARAVVLREQIAATNDQLKTLFKKFNSESENEIRTMFYAQQIGDLRRELAEARLLLVDAESSAQSLVEVSQGTTLSYLALRSKSPVGLGKSLIIVLSIVLGIMVGVFVAFLFEFVQKKPSIYR